MRIKISKQHVYQELQKTDLQADDDDIMNMMCKCSEQFQDLF